jgi:hypothetical protein
MVKTSAEAGAMSSASRVALGRSGLRGRTAAQWFCLVVGVVLALRGLQQLVSGASFATPGEGWRATEQLLMALLLLVGQRTATGARWVLVPFAIFYAVLTVVGNVNGHEAFGLLPVDGRDKVVHPIYAVLATLLLVVGWRRARPGARRASAG